MSDRQRSARGACSTDEPPRVFSVARMREVDRLAVDRYQIPSIILMENAARSVVEVIAAWLPPGRVSVVCGPGNNGGDGYAVARHLHNRRWDVTLIGSAPSDRLSPDARINARIADRMGLRSMDAASGVPPEVMPALASSDLIVDAIFGTGLSRPPSGACAEMILAINQARTSAKVLSVDVPSGLDADTGRPAGDDRLCIRADVTVTLAGLKVGLSHDHARRYTGRLAVGSIGVPEELLDELADR